MGHEANLTAADGISHAGVLPELATDAGSTRWSHHFRRPVERPFTAQERDHVTILFGGLTWKHERFIQAAFLACGYRFEPVPNLAWILQFLLILVLGQVLILQPSSEVPYVPRAVTILSYLYVVRLRQRLLIKRVRDNLAYSMAGLPAFQDLFDVEIKIPLQLVIAHCHAPSARHLGLPERCYALAERPRLLF